MLESAKLIDEHGVVHMRRTGLVPECGVGDSNLIYSYDGLKLLMDDAGEWERLKSMIPATVVLTMEGALPEVKCGELKCFGLELPPPPPLTLNLIIC